VELRHQHTGGHALAGDIAKHKEELPIDGNQVAVVATDGTERGVMIARVPTTCLQVHLWQKIATAPGKPDQGHVAAQLVVTPSVIEAVAHQRIGQQSVLSIVSWHSWHRP